MGLSLQKCAFFDRDGVINKDSGYVYKREDFIFCEGLFELLDELKKQGYLLLVITNQSGIARGYYSESDLNTLHEYMQNELKGRLGFGFDKIYFCPHSPDSDCECRKPKPGMVLEACREFQIDLSNSFFVGDKLTDMECAFNAGIKKRYLITEQNLPKNPPHSKNSSLHYQIISSLDQLRCIITAQNKTPTMTKA